MEPKTPEDIYKSHLENTRPSFGGSQVDSARQNLASSFVNGFVNCGFGKDKLLMEDGNSGNSWFHKNKEHGTSCSREGKFLPVNHKFCFIDVDVSVQVE